VTDELLEMTVWMNGSVIARASNLLVARGAYEAAVKQYPHAHIMLRHRARIIEQNRMATDDR